MGQYVGIALTHLGPGLQEDLGLARTHHVISLHCCFLSVKTREEITKDNFYILYMPKNILHKVKRQTASSRQITIPLMTMLIALIYQELPK